jgi:hypothetical protein
VSASCESIGARRWAGKGRRLVRAETRRRRGEGRRGWRVGWPDRDPASSADVVACGARCVSRAIAHNHGMPPTPSVIPTNVGIHGARMSSPAGPPAGQSSSSAGPCLRRGSRRGCQGRRREPSLPSHRNEHGVAHRYRGPRQQPAQALTEQRTWRDAARVAPSLALLLRVSARTNLLLRNGERRPPPQPLL